MMSLEESIKEFEEKAEELEKRGLIHCDSMEDTMKAVECRERAAEHRQIAEWLRELQRYRFKISECKAILDNPTLDVTDNDWKRAMYMLQIFPDVRGDER